MLRAWNASMFEVVSIMRNHTWQNYTRYYLPKLVTITSYPIESNIVMMYWFFRNFSHNTTVTNETVDTYFAYPTYMKLNYTAFFYNISTSYMNLTRSALNVTRNITELILNGTYNLTSAAFNVTVNWTRVTYNFTCTVVNSTVSLVNGSLVNETVNHHVYAPGGYFYFTARNFSMNLTDKVLNYTMCLVNETVREALNKTISPFVTIYNTVKSVGCFCPKVQQVQPESKFKPLQFQNEGMSHTSGGKCYGFRFHQLKSETAVHICCLWIYSFIFF